MDVKQIEIKAPDWSPNIFADSKNLNPHLVVVFGAPKYFVDGSLGKRLREIFPTAQVIGCSTAGEIGNSGVLDQSLVVSCIRFDKPVQLHSTSTPLSLNDASLTSGRILGEKLKNKDVKAVFVLGQGVNINGSKLIEGLATQLDRNTIITGGLAGDDVVFEKTYTVLNDTVSSDAIVALSFAGDSLQIGYASMGGWEAFGPVRRVTKANNNILYAIDGEPALEIYKKYLGDKAKDLPGAGLLYPFAVLSDDSRTTGIIRTILGVNEADGSLTLAGDIHEGGLVRLMHSQNEGLVDGAEGAANKAYSMLTKNQDEGLGLLISCVGRKLVMGDDTEDEIDAVRKILGPGIQVTGFYSYGEICPFEGVMDCRLHNQTMTITVITEN